MGNPIKLCSISQSSTATPTSTSSTNDHDEMMMIDGMMKKKIPKRKKNKKFCILFVFNCIIIEKKIFNQFGTASFIPGKFLC